MGKFDGKRLLELGTNVGSVELVQYARSEGAYVIVTDYLPTERSAAKQYADETAMVSTTDVEAVYQLAAEKRVDAIFCGVSEVHLQVVNQVAERLHLNCYFTAEQWHVLNQKAEFRKICVKHGLDVPQEYELSKTPTREELDRVRYPVIVKSVDRASGIGIHICRNEAELLEGYKDALEQSYAHEALVEQYVVGTEFSAAYTVVDGVCRMSSMGDKILRAQEGLLPLPEAYIYPSRNLERYRAAADKKVRAIIRDVGLKNGTVFFQGIADADRLVFFEAVLRMGGTALFRFISRINGINILHALTNYAITGRMDADVTLEDANLKGKKCCLLSLLNGGGTIGTIRGVEEAIKTEGVFEWELRYREGAVIPRSGTLKQSHIRFFVARDSAGELAESIQTIQSLVSVLDTDGNNMLLPPFDASVLELYR